MLIVIQTVLPVFLLMAVGSALQRFSFFSGSEARTLSHLVYWVGLPCLLFDKISNTSLDWSPIVQILSVFWLATGLATLLGWGLARYLRYSRASTVAFVQACFRGNLGFVGLPVLFYAGATLFPHENTKIQMLAVLTLAVTAPVFNFLAVLLMVGGQSSQGQGTWRSFWFQIFTNPLILSALLGILFASMHWRLPLTLARVIQSLSQMTIPLALMSMGAIFVQMPWRGALSRPLLAAMVKVGITPAVGLGLCHLFQLSPAETCVVLVYLATPTAVVSFVLVEQFHGDETLAVNAVVISTLLSMLTLPVVLRVL